MCVRGPRKVIRHGDPAPPRAQGSPSGDLGADASLFPWTQPPRSVLYVVTSRILGRRRDAEAREEIAVGGQR